MDVTAAGSIAAALEGARWSVSALPRGDGLVRTSHGLLPVPAPATARLLHGFTWRDDGIGGERVTPTGAAILCHLVHAPDARAGGRLQTTGTGAGTRELPGQPNILRATLYAGATSPAEEDILVLCFEIDDMTGEELGVAADRLRALPGVRDLVLIPAFGKKGRPIHSFQLLVEPPHQEEVAEACFTETSTIGLRWQEARRAVLPRTLSDAEPVRVKTVTRPAGPSRKAESDDLARIAGLDRTAVPPSTRRGVMTALDAILTELPGLAIAVSGGVDSMTLAHAAHRAAVPGLASCTRSPRPCPRKRPRACVTTPPASAGAWWKSMPASSPTRPIAPTRSTAATSVRPTCIPASPM